MLASENRDQRDAAQKVRRTECACRHAGGREPPGDAGKSPTEKREPTAAPKARPIYPPLLWWSAQRRIGQTPTGTFAARLAQRRRVANAGTQVRFRFTTRHATSGSAYAG